MTTVALIGASGFVGSQVRVALQRRGAKVVRVVAPRLNTDARELANLMAEVVDVRRRPEIRTFAQALAGCDAVVNAAGVATATAHGDSLFGANALLPGLIAAVSPTGARLVHISSAAVQGRRKVLDETEETAPFSPYSSSKAEGEALVLTIRPDGVCYRPTSVHGAGRSLTRSLVRVLRSPLASVAGTGDQLTPQVRVENVGDAIAFLALTSEAPPRIVLHPNEDMTTGELVRRLGGRDPLHVPVRLARSLVALGFSACRAVPATAGIARRLEMLWFGQDQGPSWLDERWAPIKGTDSWAELA